ncbi:MAG: phosphoribosylformylglycinamidine cyclo-ligase [Actinomycetota bacterium]|nr:phosphoribosylformylglycinamidine cyclo-ligase [Actinomycetota bacterium]
MNEDKPVSGADYLWAGIDLGAASDAVRLIGEKVSSTMRPEVMGRVGGFGAMFKLDTSRYREPILVSATDGVGTKLKIAQMMDRHDTVGIDLLAMCADDVVTTGAEPLFFEDYIATGKLVPEKIAAIVGGMAEGCKKAGCALIGGETAEHPGVMEPDEYDLAGFCVGVVEKSEIIDGSRVKLSDSIVGIASAGLHSNGYSLVRKLLFDSGDYKLGDRIADFGFELGEELLAPSHIYARAVLKTIKSCEIGAIAHVTGGGITENLPRVLPKGMGAEIEVGSWEVLPIFKFLQKVGNVDLAEMFRVFNMGVGMLLVMDPGWVPRAIEIIEGEGYKAYEIGKIIGEGEGVRYS